MDHENNLRAAARCCRSAFHTSHASAGLQAEEILRKYAHAHLGMVSGLRTVKNHCSIMATPKYMPHLGHI